MATSMASAFTSADRRKPTATYGKRPRPITNFDWTGDDAPSPQRPRKQASSSISTLQKPTGSLGAGSTLKAVSNSRTKPVISPASQDVFDVPSDEEMVTPPSPPRANKQARKQTLKPVLKPVPKQTSKQTAPTDEFDVPSSGDEAPLPRKRIAKPPQMLRKPEPAPVSPVKKRSGPSHAETTSSDVLPAPTIRRTKAPQVSHKPEGGERAQVQAVKRPAMKSSSVLQEMDNIVPKTGTHKRMKSASGLPPKKSIAKPSPDLDIFDVPSSEEDAPLRTPRRPRPTPLPRAKTPAISRAASGLKSPGPSAESDDSNASKKRKRRPSALSSTAHRETEDIEKTPKPILSQRSNKFQKKEGCISPRQQRGEQSVTAKPAPPKELMINKPKRTRLRTAQGPDRAPVAKVQSSPAKLHGMLAVRSNPKPSPMTEVAEDIIEDDITMYDIQDPAIPVLRSTRKKTTGSVTPRQKAIFDNLLDDSSGSNSPGMPSVSRLRLTDRKPGSLLAGLARSSSDIPQTTYSRKPRLIDTLIQASSDSKESDDSESDEETEEGITEIPTISAPTTYGSRGKGPSTAVESDEMDVEPEAPTNSQTSQNALLLNNGAKVTYAKQRSYVEESNLEDGLLMDIDDLLGGFDSKRRPDSISEDDDPASQVRGIHELRKQGQSHKFQLEAQSVIDDISGKGGLGPSLRRSAMVDFCTKMADQKFNQQLLDSALGHQFLGSIKSKGEIVFDFAAAAAISFILKMEPGYTVLGQIQHSSIVESLTKLLDSAADISRIAKDRKTNMSKIGQESVNGLRILVQNSLIWNQGKPDKISPQILAMKSLELLVLALRKAGSTEALLPEGVISKLIDIASGPCDRLKSGKETPQDFLILNMTFSIMEAVSASKERQVTWSSNVVQRLVETIPVFFETSGPSPIKLAIRLCMNLTNNKPKACHAFAGPSFVKPLVRSISHKFAELAGDLNEEQRSELLEGLILSLGAMINLAEFSDKARASVVVDDDELVDALASIFLEGSERAAQADSMEESQSSVTVGYLSILLGNLCLNDLVRSKVRSRLPGRKIDMLVENVREFVRYNEKVDRETNQFQGEEGREIWRMFTMRLLLVVERLEQLEK